MAWVRPTHNVALPIWVVEAKLSAVNGTSELSSALSGLGSMVYRASTTMVEVRVARVLFPTTTLRTLVAATFKKISEYQTTAATSATT